MLRAPTRSPDRAANQQTPISVSRATLRDVPRLAVGHTAARATRRTPVLRWLISPAVLTTALQLIGQVDRGEVFTSGHGSSVVMTPTEGRRRVSIHAIIAAAGAYLLFVILVPVLVAVTSAAIGGQAGDVGISAAAMYLLAIVAGPVLAASGRGRRRVARSAAAALQASRGPVVRLHDLVRDPRDTAGTGVALLQAVIRDPQFETATIITTAASSRLARSYEAAGMTSWLSTTTLYRQPSSQRAGVSA